MSRDNVSTPARGETMYEGETPDTNNLKFVELEGQVKVFEDIDWGNSSNVKPYRAYGRKVVCKLVRNMSGVPIYAKRLVKLDKTNPGRVTGFADTLAEECYPADEFLPSAGVLNGDLFWIVISGPAMCLTSLVGATFQTASIAAGALLIGTTTSAGSTAAGTTAEAGRIVGYSPVALTSIAQFLELLNVTQNCVGRAMSAVTSGQTNAPLLVDVGRKPSGGT